MTRVRCLVASADCTAPVILISSASILQLWRTTEHSRCDFGGKDQGKGRCISIRCDCPKEEARCGQATVRERVGEGIRDEESASWFFGADKLHAARLQGYQTGLVSESSSSFRSFRVPEAWNICIHGF